jgi:hypothetical protein
LNWLSLIPEKEALIPCWISQFPLLRASSSFSFYEKGNRQVGIIPSDNCQEWNLAFRESCRNNSGKNQLALRLDSCLLLKSSSNANKSIRQAARQSPATGNWLPICFGETGAQS